MTEPDLTGWTPHDPKNGRFHDGFPTAIPEADTPVIALLRGKPDTGSKESGPVPARALSWLWHPGEPSMDLPESFVERRALFAPGDIIAWCFATEAAGRTVYPNVRPGVARVEPGEAH